MAWTLYRYLTAMGTEVELAARATGADRGRLEAALDAAVRWLRQAERILSRFQPASELSRLNAAAGRPCRVSPLLAAVLDAALDSARETGGLYDPTVLPCLLAAGYRTGLPPASRRGSVAGGEAPADWRPCWAQVALDRQARFVTLPPGAALDFGGIAKGWAADAIVAAWPGDAPLVVNVGGDVRVHVPAGDDAGWPVHVADPFAPDRDLARLRLPGGGVATSSVLGRRWLTPQGWRHHIIDPRTGAPANTDVAQATVLAATATQAEVWVKAVCILGSAAGLAFLAPRPAAALVVCRDGTCLATANLEVYLDGLELLDSFKGCGAAGLPDPVGGDG